jgi:hypothetical protein
VFTVSYVKVEGALPVVLVPVVLEVLMAEVVKDVVIDGWEVLDDVVMVVCGLDVVDEELLEVEKVEEVVCWLDADVCVPGRDNAYAPAARTITRITTAAAMVATLLIPFLARNRLGSLLISKFPYS